MSRIDQALRRAAAAGTPSLVRDISAGPSSEKAESLLDAYPTEMAAPLPMPPPIAPPATAPLSLAPPPIAAPPVVVPAVTSAAPSILSPVPERPTLAKLPSAVSIEKRFAGSPLEGKIVGTSTMDPAAVEQYLALATALRTIQVARSLRTIMVSSAVAGEGKTLTAVNLALVLSERVGKRVLLVDADFEAPSIHEIFQMLNVSGLGDALSSDNASVPVIAVSKNLAVLPCGRIQPDSMSALLSPRMKALLLDAASNFDWIVLDTPPVTKVTDPQLLAWLADGVVLVVEAGKTPTKAVQAAIEELGADRVLGTVLNRASARSVELA